MKRCISSRVLSVALLTLFAVSMLVAWEAAQAQTISTYAGGGSTPVGSIGSPRAVRVGPEGSIYYIASQQVFRIAPTANGSPVVSLVAGNGADVGVAGDGGPATGATHCYASSLALDAAGNVFIRDGGGAIRRVDAPTGTITVAAARDVFGYPAGGGVGLIGSVQPFIWGPGCQAPNGEFGAYAVAVDAAGNPWMLAAPIVGFGLTTDEGNGPLFGTEGIYRADAVTGNVTQIGSTGFYSDYFGSSGVALAVDGSGNSYVASATQISRVDRTAGILTTVAGTGTTGFSGDGGPATSAQLRNVSDGLLPTPPAISS